MSRNPLVQFQMLGAFSRFSSPPQSIVAGILILCKCITGSSKRLPRQEQAARVGFATADLCNHQMPCHYTPASPAERCSCSSSSTKSSGISEVCGDSQSKLPQVCTSSKRQLHHLQAYFTSQAGTEAEESKPSEIHAGDSATHVVKSQAFLNVSVLAALRCNADELESCCIR